MANKSDVCCLHEVGNAFDFNKPGGTSALGKYFNILEDVILTLYLCIVQYVCLKFTLSINTYSTVRILLSSDWDQVIR